MASEGEVADTGDRTGLEVGHVEVADDSVQETVLDSDDVELMAWKVATDGEELDMDGDKQAVLDPMTSNAGPDEAGPDEAGCWTGPSDPPADEAGRRLDSPEPPAGTDSGMGVAGLLRWLT